MKAIHFVKYIVTSPGGEEYICTALATTDKPYVDDKVLYVLHDYNSKICICGSKFLQRVEPKQLVIDFPIVLTKRIISYGMSFSCDN